MKKRILLNIFAGMFIAVHLSWAQPIGMLPQSGEAKEVSSLASLAKIPILDQGRVKPLDTYAENVLLQFSGRRSLNKKPAIQWFARLLFAPEKTQDDQIFLINSPEIPMALGVEPNKKRHYSYSQLEPGFEKLAQLAEAAKRIEEKQRAIVEKEVIRAHQNVRLYIQLTNALSFAFVHKDFQITDMEIINLLKLEKGRSLYSYLDIIRRADMLYDVTKPLETKDQSAWTQQDRETFRLVTNVFHWTSFYANSTFTIIPDTRPEGEWLSPWRAIISELQNPFVQEEVHLLQQLAAYYWDGKQLEFNFSAKALEQSVYQRLNVQQKKSADRIPIELIYNQTKPFLWAKLFYGFAFLVFLFSLLLKKSFTKNIAFVFIILGVIPHVFALMARIVILARPPVSNLYETFIFVGLITVIFGLVIEKFNKRWLGILVSSVGGFSFLMIAGKYAAEGDTLQMLVAVLNSNFWLSTHVISITIGYAGCCVTGIIGHLYLIQSVIRPNDKQLLQLTYNALFSALIFGLMMAFLGTMLGGIWADQSWGRFWGWDPKENGALMIVLWCALILHAKISRWIGPLGLAVGAVWGMITVMWAWLGVNLLSIGLHSYGFTSGIALTLLIYFFCEISFLAVVYPLAKKRQK